MRLLGVYLVKAWEAKPEGLRKRKGLGEKNTAGEREDQSSSLAELEFLFDGIPSTRLQHYVY